MPISARPDHVNPAFKLSLLYRDTDIDFLWLGEGSRSARYGFDVSRNFGTNLEVHGEWARILDFEQPVLARGRQPGALRRRATPRATSSGLRYLTERDTTWIVEYYRNGTGYSEAQAQAFYEAAHAGAAARRAAAGAAQRRAGRLRAAEPDAALPLCARQPEGAVRHPLLHAERHRRSSTWTTAADSLIGELLYTGFGDFEVRLRAAVNLGERLTEFGEKPVDERLELRLRWHF